MHFARLGVSLALAALTGCGGGAGAPMDAGAAGQRDAGRARDAGRSRDGGSGRDARIVLPDAGGGAHDPDGGAGDPDGGTPVEVTEVRFIVMGDTGEGNAAQHEVADAIEVTCASLGCDFVVLLGDNIYDAGVDSVEDAQWEAKFEAPYRDIALPFYAVLGNHDYGGYLPLIGEQGGLGNEWDKGPFEVEYTAHSSKWTMPSTFYTFRAGNVGFVMLDTNSLVWNNDDHGDQRAWFAGAVAALRADGAEWIIAAGHHPYLSNGRHGNAGDYESIEVGGLEIPNPVPILDGENVQDFFDDYACGEIDVYFAGHDHNRQWIDEPSALCGAELIVSGAGAKTTEFASEISTLHWGDDTTEGFLYVRIRGDEMYGRFVNRDGTTAFERVALRRSATP